MKRIGLVTWFGGSNYGTSLQAFALNYVILKLGAECFLMKKCLTWRNVARLILIRIKRNKLQNRSEEHTSELQSRYLITSPKRTENKTI